MTTHKQDDHSNDSPFEQVRAAEEQQRLRVEEQKAVLDLQMQEEVRLIHENTAKKEAAMRDAARLEMEEFASNEPVAILQKARKEAAGEVQRVEQAYAAKANPVIASLVAEVLNVSVPSIELCL